MTIEKKVGKENVAASTPEPGSLHDQVSKIYYHGFSNGDWREVHEEALEGRPIEWLDQQAQRIYDEGNELKSTAVREFMTRNRATYVTGNIVRNRA